jgi:hypothetical protein
MVTPLKIEITSYEEHDDGSATVTMDLSDEVKSVLIEEGFLACLNRYIEAKDENPQESP